MHLITKQKFSSFTVFDIIFQKTLQKHFRTHFFSQKSSFFGINYQKNVFISNWSSVFLKLGNLVFVSVEYKIVCKQSLRLTEGNKSF